MPIEITSEAFPAGQPIPVQFTGDGEDGSPPLRWSGLPPGTRELALIMDDPDAPGAEPFVHWVMYRIPGATGGLGAHVPKTKKLDDPAGAMQGVNSFGRVGYGGPAPPRGHGTHHYHFHLFALDKPLDLQPGLDHKSLRAAMAGHILEEADLVGTYER